MDSTTQQWQKIRAIHFHPSTGTRFWLEKARQLSLDVFQQVNGPDDFWKLGELTLDMLRNIPPDHFVPANFQGEKMPFESAGTSGEPVMTYFSPLEFEMAFVKPFLRTVEEGLFPSQGHWLYLGPSGPHAIGHVATLCSLAISGQRPYTVDFDPRWAKKLPEDSMPAKRYIAHICEQALDVFKKVDISILFVTPPVLNILSQQLSENIRKNITGIQLAGMGVEENQWRHWKELFPSARFLIGYGNSLVGVFYPSSQGKGYYLHQGRIRIDLIPFQGENRLKEKVPSGQKGQIVVHRLDETVLYLNLCERDEAIWTRNGENVFLKEVSPLSTLQNIRKGIY